jgi:hypothetical protein
MSPQGSLKRPSFEDHLPGTPGSCGGEGAVEIQKEV